MSKEANEIAAWLVATQASDIDNLRVEKSKLKGEIAELRDFLVKVSTCEIETFSFEVGDSGDTDCIEYVCTDIVEEANELLAKYK